MRDLASPVAAFVREKCEVGINKEIAVGLLFEAYKLWCDANNYPKSPMPVFARDLRAAVAGIRVRQAGPHENRVRVYVGIDLVRIEPAHEPLLQIHACIACLPPALWY